MKTYLAAVMEVLMKGRSNRKETLSMQVDGNKETLATLQL